MERVHHKNDIEQLECLFDGEGPDERAPSLREHSKRCPACKRILWENRQIASSVREIILREIDGVDVSGLERSFFERIGKTSRKRWSGEIIFSLSRRVWIPATVGVTAALLFLVFFSLPSSVEPSAVVYSLKADVFSVMILETPGSRQTVLWFEEGASKDGRQGRLNRLDKVVVELLGKSRCTNLKEGSWRA